MIRTAMFLNEFLLFTATMVIGLVAAFRYEARTSGLPIIQAPALSINDVVFVALLFTFFLVLFRFNRFTRGVFRFFLALVLFSGIQIMLGTFLPVPLGIFLALAAVIAFIFWSTVIAHDLAIMLALAGLGAAIGLSITPSLAVIALVSLSFYDIIAVYKTRHMVRMAEGMLASGAIFGFIVPSGWRAYFARQPRSRQDLGEQFMLLGSGDVALPLVFAASLIRQSVAEAATVAIFASLGLALTHVLFFSQKQRAPMAALPPIAAMSLIGYIVSLLLFV